MDIFSREEVKILSENSKKTVEIFKNEKDLKTYNLSLANYNDSVETCSNSNYSVLVDRRRAEFDNGMMDIFNPQKINLSFAKNISKKI